MLYTVCMEKQLKNDIVSLIPIDQKYVIFHDGTQIGELSIHNSMIDIRIDSRYQGNHFATNALYLLTGYAHDVLNMKEMRAVVPVENEIFRHVVEHCGYHIAEKNSDYIVYVHTKAHNTKDDRLIPEKGTGVIYLAGGCFWGMERVFQMLDGVIETKTGYANGTVPHPSYEDIIRNETGYRECVRVIYDINIISLTTILKAFFLCIDPTVKNRQKDDIGSQYQTGIYYRNVSDLNVIRKTYNQEKQKHDRFFVELKPLECFYEAEEYHQNYLVKNPEGYCHITPVDLEKVKQLNRKS